LAPFLSAQGGHFLSQIAFRSAATIDGALHQAAFIMKMIGHDLSDYASGPVDLCFAE
jgi:hypothetical protein